MGIIELQLTGIVPASTSGIIPTVSWLALKEMKLKLEANDQVGAIKDSLKIEENWSAVEDNVKTKSKDLYEKVEAL